MATDFPPPEKLERYLAMLRNVLVDARFRAYEHDAQSAALLDAVENVPDLLTRWSECNEAWLIAALQEYERRFNISGERYSQILIGAPSRKVQRVRP